MASVSLAAPLSDGFSLSGETPEGPVDDRDDSFSDPSKLNHSAGGNFMSFRCNERRCSPSTIAA